MTQKVEITVFPMVFGQNESCFMLNFESETMLQTFRFSIFGHFRILPGTERVSGDS